MGKFLIKKRMEDFNKILKIFVNFWGIQSP